MADQLLHRLDLELRVRMYFGLRRRGWTRARAAGYAIRNPRSFAALREAIRVQERTR